jgi:energy-coupling factor transport system permease protein
MGILLASHDEEPFSAWVDGCVRLERVEERSVEPTSAARAPSAGRGRSHPGRAFHYRDTATPFHRLGAGWKLALVTAACAAAVAVETPAGQALLLAALLAGYRLARLSPSELWQDARWLVLQGLLITALSLARDGAGGLARGLSVATQIALFFLPGALAVRTTSTRQWQAALQRALPARLSFAVAASLRFAPYFARELHEIVGAQRLRGARLAPRDLWRPRAWRDWSLCVGVPLAVRIIHTANEAALAAEIRGLATAGPHPEEEVRWKGGS